MIDLYCLIIRKTTCNEKDHSSPNNLLFLIRVCKEILKHDKYAVNDDDCENNTALHLACIHGHSR